MSFCISNMNIGMFIDSDQMKSIELTNDTGERCGESQGLNSKDKHDLD